MPFPNEAPSSTAPAARYFWYNGQRYLCDSQSRNSVVEGVVANQQGIDLSNSLALPPPQESRGSRRVARGVMPSGASPNYSGSTSQDGLRRERHHQVQVPRYIQDGSYGEPSAVTDGTGNGRRREASPSSPSSTRTNMGSWDSPQGSTHNGPRRDATVDPSFDAVQHLPRDRQGSRPSLGSVGRPTQQSGSLPLPNLCDARDTTRLVGGHLPMQESQGVLFRAPVWAESLRGGRREVTETMRLAQQQFPSQRRDGTAGQYPRNLSISDEADSDQSNGNGNDRHNRPNSKSHIKDSKHKK
ncbi:hypothetical protein G7046_g5610 [Stylonectria norvegica]|nr:hypothetical protein G7046_g5610 [Stylonectria norvegica]